MKTLSWWHLAAPPIIYADAVWSNASTALAVLLAIAIPVACWVIEAVIGWGRDVADKSAKEGTK